MYNVYYRFTKCQLTSEPQYDYIVRYTSGIDDRDTYVQQIEAYRMWRGDIRDTSAKR